MILKMEHFAHLITNQVTDEVFKTDFDDEISMPTYKANELEMITGLYFPEFLSLANRVKETRSNLIVQLIKCVSLTSGKKEYKLQYKDKETMMQNRDIFLEAAERFKNKITDNFSNIL